MAVNFQGTGQTHGGAGRGVGGRDPEGLEAPKEGRG